MGRPDVSNAAARHPSPADPNTSIRLGAAPPAARGQRQRRLARRRGSLSRRLAVPLSILQGAALVGAQSGNGTSTNSTRTPIPLLVTNNCPDTLWPGVGTQHGVGP